MSTPASPAVAIRSILPSLPPAERRVAEAVLSRPAEIVTLSIGTVAEQASTSEATVVRFCKKAGFDGYPDLRLALASEAGRSAAEGRDPTSVTMDIGPEDALADVVAKAGAIDTQAIADTVTQLDIEVLARVVDQLAVARRIELYGVGASGLVAIDFEQKLRRIGLPAAASVDGHAALTSAAVLTPDDVAVGVSHSGQTIDIIDPIELARSRNASTVAITNYPQSALASIADLVLTTAARESLFRAGAMASRSAQLTVIDCIYLGVAQKHYGASVRALDETSAAVQDRRRKPTTRRR